MYTSRKPYYQLKKSMSDFFSGYTRFIKQSLEKESVAEKPYLGGDYQQMHLNLPGFDFAHDRAQRSLPVYGPGVGGSMNPPDWVWTKVSFTDPNCSLTSGGSEGDCAEGLIIFLKATARTFWSPEELHWYSFVSHDSSGGVGIGGLSKDGNSATFVVDIAGNYNGTAVVCVGFSYYTLLSATFKSIAGLPVTLNINPTNGLRFLGLVPGQEGAYVVGEAELINLNYGQAASTPCCTTISSSCTGADPVEWDYSSSAETITPEDNVSIFVLAGTGPYTWEVDGTDFTLDEAVTSTGENILIAGIDSCGAATITVTDANDDVVVAAVRSTVGSWVQQVLNSGSFSPVNCNVADIADKAYDIITKDATRTESQTWRFCCTNAGATPIHAGGCKLTNPVAQCSSGAWYSHDVCWVYREDRWEC